MSKRRQKKSGSRSRKKKVLRGRNGAERTIYDDGTESMKLSPQMAEIIKGQLERFREKFGREPGPHDPIFFDPEADEPKPISQAKLDQQWNEMVAHAIANGLPPELGFAAWATNRVVTVENIGLLTREEKREWHDAVEEYLAGETKRARVFRVLTVESCEIKSKEDVGRVMILAQELGVYDDVVKQIQESFLN